RTAVMRILTPIAGLVFIALMPLGYKGLSSAGLEPRAWLWLLLVPGLHWFALHRILARLRRDLEQLRPGQGEGPSFALPIADVTWLLAIIPWLVLAIAGGWQYVPPC